MYNYNYRNPLAKTYQFEYAVYMVLAGSFRSVSCRSNALETIRLYYLEKVKGGESNNKKKYRLTEDSSRKVRAMICRALGRGGIESLDAHIKILRMPEGNHVFVIDCGRGMRCALMAEVKGRRKTIVLRDLSIREISENKTRVGSSAAS